MANYEVYDEDPVAMKLQNGDFTVYVPRPPSGGVVYQYILNILDGKSFGMYIIIYIYIYLLHDREQ